MRRERKLELRVRDLEAVLQAVVDHLKVLTRWPCGECGRIGPNRPLRAYIIVQEDNSETYTGCQTCNNDALIARIEKALNG